MTGKGQDLFFVLVLVLLVILLLLDVPFYHCHQKQFIPTLFFGIMNSGVMVL